jgi:hypothetical protein
LRWGDDPGLPSRPSVLTRSLKDRSGEDGTTEVEVGLVPFEDKGWGSQAKMSSRIKKRQGNRFSSGVLKGTQTCQHLDFKISNFHACVVLSHEVSGNLLQRP